MNVGNVVFHGVHEVGLVYVEIDRVIVPGDVFLPRSVAALFEAKNEALANDQEQEDEVACKKDENLHW